jgi:hypothetical protein
MPHDWNQPMFDFRQEHGDRSSSPETAPLRAWGRGRITSNFVNEFNIFGAIKSDSIGSVGGGSLRADAFEVLSGEGICGPALRAPPM